MPPNGDAAGDNAAVCGLLSAGVTKICNNLSLGIAMVGTAEAMNLVGNDVWVVLCDCVHHYTSPVLTASQPLTPPSLLGV